jgi:hypothetical protein
LIPFELEFQATLRLDTLVHKHGYNGPHYCANVTVLESNNPALAVGYQRALIFKYNPQAHGIDEQKNRVVLGQLGSLVAAVFGRELRDDAFDVDAAKVQLMQASATVPSIGMLFTLTQTVRQTDKGPRTNRDFAPATR